jgi:hypothetical protein
MRARERGLISVFDDLFASSRYAHKHTHTHTYTHTHTHTHTYTHTHTLTLTHTHCTQKRISLQSSRNTPPSPPSSISPHHRVHVTYQSRSQYPISTITLACAASLTIPRTWTITLPIRLKHLNHDTTPVVFLPRHHQAAPVFHSHPPISVAPTHLLIMDTRPPTTDPPHHCHCILVSEFT